MANYRQYIPTGIASLPQVNWGTHFCHFYKNKEELIRVAVPFIKAGLDDNEKCILITSDILEGNEVQQEFIKKGTDVKGCIDSGQLVIVDYKAWYTRQAKFDIDSILKQWVEAENLALDGGYSGLRATGVMPPLLFHEYRDNVVHYETIVDSIMKRLKMIAICCYSLEDLRESEVVQVVVNHDVVFIQYADNLIAVGNAKSAKIRIMKDKGFSYADIGSRIGITKQRAHQILNKRKRKRKKPRKESQRLLTVSGVASLLNVHVNTIRRWSDRRIITASRLGPRGDRRFRREDIDNLVRP